MEQDDFNSSDIEFGDAPRNPWANVSKASIQAIIDNAAEDRINSKFEAFRQHTLKASTNEAPKGQDIERFLTSIVSRVKPRSHEVPAYSWLQGGVRHLTNSLVFHCPTFKLSRHETQRIASVIHQHFEEGRITKDPAREKCWVGSFLVRKLATALLEDGLVNGTLNWDVALSEVTSIVLMAALQTRAGDIARIRLDNQPLPYLCYNDITIKLVGGNKIENLQARFVIRNGKGFKDDPAKNRTVVCHCLESPDNNPLCPIKLTLILALRFGNVNGKSIDEVLLETQSRQDKTVVWTKGERPLICATIPESAGLHFDKAANNVQISAVLASAGLIAGVLAPITSHDLRRGAARDTANLKAKINGVTTEAVAVSLGHSSAAHKKGTTGMYVGSLTDDTWTKRVEENFRDPFEVQVADGAYKRKRRLTQSEVSTRCVNEGLDVSDRKIRKQLGQTHKKEDAMDWMQREQNRVEAPSDRSDKLVLSPWTPSQINAVAPPEDIPTNPELLAEGTNLGHVLAGSDNMTMRLDLENAVFGQMQTSASARTDISTAPIDFVRRFSTINITRNQNLVRVKPRTSHCVEKYIGNSRDEPSFFQFPAKNVVFGCQYQNAALHLVNMHERTCPITSIEALVERKQKKEFQCKKEGCSSSFDTQGKLNGHVKQVHDWKPKACGKEGCDPNVVFQTQGQHKKHIHKQHSSFVPTKCTVPDCKSTVVFQVANKYDQHLRCVHWLTGKDKERYLKLRSDPFAARKCQVAGCNTKTVFKFRYILRKYLEDKHGLTGDQLTPYLK